MDLAIGIDVGFSASRRSTGVVILDRQTKDVASGSRPVVDTATLATAFVCSEIARLKPATVTACVDGSFAPALPGTKVRLVERFFMSGPFSSGSGLRLSPAPTPAGSRFLATTVAILAALRAVGLSPMTVSATSVAGDVVEVFPTLFMAALLPPLAYLGTRSRHTDDLWLRLIGHGPTPTGALHPSLAPYAALVRTVESSARRDLHDLRTAAVSAIAADWFARPTVAGTATTMFIGEQTELGFVLPPRPSCDPTFLAMLSSHWTARAAALPGLVWF
jgi:hypothetical protein